MTGLGADFRRLWLSSAVSNLGDGVRLTALPLLAAAVTRDPVAVAAVSVAAELPWLLVSLPAGALADRVDRRRLMVAVQLVRMCLAALLTATVLADRSSIAVLCAFVFLLGIGEVVYDAAAPTILPRIVPREQLTRGNARLFGVELGANEFAGPPLGGLLFRLGQAVPFVLDAVSFAASAALLSRLRGTFRPAGAADGPKAGVVRAIGEGFGWLWRNPVIRTLSVVVTFMNLARAMTMAVFVLYALETLDLSAVGYGVLSSAVAVGAVAGSWAAERIRPAAAGPCLVAAVLGHGLTTVAMGATSNPWVAGASSAGFGFATMTWSVLTAAVRQTVVPDRLLGRISSVHRFLSWGSLPLGSLLGGVLAAAYGLRVPFAAGGAAVVLAALVAARTLLGVSALLAGPGGAGGVGGVDGAGEAGGVSGSGS
ncbi:MFS transporter [Streptomyces sp. WAC 06738]|uniref:MFS transporter n=1 Tax=Streptomyces sp. WAC 06738 TaxID=2203210 RepID=UPI000F710136|nr:MFS transporter [Streptomyces sp. WAC 06738]AZM47092.1 MFS transporter [Streptomyces sp. WAC 06738]